ncbi:hypothetical protein ACOMHN_042074 [Nucella lapillus]
MAASSNRLSGTVIEDAEPLERSGVASVAPTLAPCIRPQMGVPERSVTSRSPQQTGHRGGVTPSQQTRSREHHAGLTARETVSQQQTGGGGGGAQDSYGMPLLSLKSTDSLGSLVSRSDVSSFPREEEASMESDVLKGMSKALSEGVLRVENPSLSFSSQPSSLESCMPGLPVSLETVDDQDIDKYRRMMPDDLKVDYYDAMILYQNSDFPLVSKFLKRVNTDVRLNKVELPQVELYDKILPHAGITRVGELDMTLDYCTYVLLFVTKRFCEEKWTEFAAQTALMNAIDSPESRWSVVPIFTEPKRHPTFKIPPSIRSLKGIQYWSEDNFYVDSLRKLLEDKVHVRLEKEQDIRRRREQWIRTEKASERRKKDLRELKDRQALQVMEDRQKKHQQSLQHLDQQFQEDRKEKTKQRIHINSMKEDLSRYGHQNPMDQNAMVHDYMENLSHHMNASNSGSVKKSQTFGEGLDQQGLAELPYNYMHLSRSMPDHFSPPALLAPPHFAGMARAPNAGHAMFPQQGHPGEWGNPTGTGQAAGSPSFNLPGYGSSHHPSPQSLPTMSLEKQGVGGKECPSVPAERGYGGQPDHQDTPAPMSQSSSQACAGAKETGVSADNNRHADRQASGDRKEQAGAPVATTLEGPDGRDESSHNIQEWEKTPEMPSKGDLVEDVPTDSHSYKGPIPAPYRQATGYVGSPYISEAIRQPEAVTRGPAHHGGVRAHAEPHERGDHGYDPHHDPRMMYGGYAATGNRVPGYRLPLQYMPHGQIHPYYMGQFQSPYFLPNFPPEFYQGPLPYPGQVPLPAYAMPPQYGGIQRFHHPPAGVPAQHIENLQYPGQFQTSWPPSALPPTPRPPPPPHTANRQQPSPPAMAEENPSPAVVHHHHFHHGRGEDPPPTTINYIKKAETVMMAENFSMDMNSTRRGGEGGPQCAEGDEAPQSVPQDASVPENQSCLPGQPACSEDAREQQSHDPTMTEESVTLTPSREYSSQSPSTLAGFREHSNSSQLTQNVSRDDRSCRTSVQSTGSTPPSPVGLPEVSNEPCNPMYAAGHLPPYSSTSPSQILPPFQPRAQFLASSTVVPEDALCQWPEQYEKERDTELKRLVMGPSADEESYPSEDREETSMKTAGIYCF